MLGKKFLALEVWGKIFVPKTKSPMPPAPPLKSEIVDPNDGLFLLMGLGTRLEGSMNKMWNHIFNGKRHAEFDIL